MIMYTFRPDEIEIALFECLVGQTKVKFHFYMHHYILSQ